MRNTRPTLEEIRRVNERRDRLSTCQENIAIASMFSIVIGFTVMMMGAMVQSDALTWAGLAGVLASPVLGGVSIIIDTFNH